MKNTLIITFFLLVVCQNISLAQNINDSIVVSGNNKVFTQNGKILNFNEIKSIVSINDEASKYISKASGNATISYIFAYAGGFCIGWPIGTLIGGGKPNWGLAAIGGGCILIALPIATAADKNVIKAVNIYNSNLNTQSTGNIKLNFGLTSSGVGLTLKF